MTIQKAAIRTAAKWSFGLLLSFCALTTQAASGVAFIHGTGHQTDAYNDYWTGDFIHSVMQKQSNPNNYVVINCDFDKYMWDSAAAGCLASQLSSYIQSNNITSLYAITHSNGGNIIRWIMSNPTYDSRYPGIINVLSTVTALAPSSAGTPLADAAVAGNTFESSLGWLLGYQSDAVRQQQVSWMASYNQNWLLGTSGRPGLPKTFKSVVGSDVDSAIWDGDSYCAGYQYQVALETTQNWLDNCSDGFLECSSQSAAGSVWFTDKSRTNGSEPLSHQQSRRDCFGLDVILRNDI
jgi:membrane protein YqaA with SNARE-associated domain